MSLQLQEAGQSAEEPRRSPQETSFLGEENEKPSQKNTFRLRSIHRRFRTFQAVAFTLFVIVFSSIVAFSGGNWLGVLLFMAALLPTYWVTWYFSWVAAVELELGSDSIMFRTREGVSRVPYGRLRKPRFILGKLGPVFLEDTTSGKRYVILRETESFPEIMRLLREQGVEGFTE